MQRKVNQSSRRAADHVQEPLPEALELPNEMPADNTPDGPVEITELYTRESYDEDTIAEAAARGAEG